MGVWLDPGSVPLYAREEKYISCPCKDSQNFYNSAHPLSNRRSRCGGMTVHKVVSNLKYVFGEDGYINFDSLD